MGVELQLAMAVFVFLVVEVEKLDSGRCAYRTTAMRRLVTTAPSRSTRST
jgi:hypothetical protein